MDLLFSENAQLHFTTRVKKKHIFWHNAINGSVDIEKIQYEIENQINIFIREFGFVPNHIDGHNHCNIFSKSINDIFDFHAKKLHIHLRFPAEDIERCKFLTSIVEQSNNLVSHCYPRYDDLDINQNLLNFFNHDMYLYYWICKRNGFKETIPFIGTRYGYVRTVDMLIMQLEEYKEEDCLQLMTHPGLYISLIKHSSSFSTSDRYDELKVLRKVQKYLKKEKIELITYKNIVSN